jgi:hypothetical protein
MTVSRSTLFSPRVVKVFILALMATLAVSARLGFPPDQHNECETWAEEGDCEKNAGFMLTGCPTSCDRARKAAAALDKELQKIESFFDLSALDINGNSLAFEELRNQVTIVVNVASHCVFTKKHYDGLVELWGNVAEENVQIIAFPCNQFGKLEPGDATEIKAFAAGQGVKFTVMEKVRFLYLPLPFIHW